MRDFWRLAVVLIMPLAIAGVLPYGAVEFAARAPGPAPDASCAFVTLTAEEETLALAEARTAWQVGVEEMSSLHASLAAETLPDEIPEPVMRAPAAAAAAPGVVGYVQPAVPFTLAAPAPRVISQTPEDPDAQQPFPRRSLLEIERKEQR